MVHTIYYLVLCNVLPGQGIELRQLVLYITQLVLNIQVAEQVIVE